MINLPERLACKHCEEKSYLLLDAGVDGPSEDLTGSAAGGSPSQRKCNNSAATRPVSSANVTHTKLHLYLAAPNSQRRRTSEDAGRFHSTPYAVLTVAA